MAAGSPSTSINASATSSATFQTTPMTMQQALGLVGRMFGPQIEVDATAYLTSRGWPTTGVITPALAQKIVAALDKTGQDRQALSNREPGPVPPSTKPTTWSARGPVLPAQFPNPSNLTPIAEPSLASPAQGLEGQFVPSVHTIDGRPVLKAFHMVATSYGPSLADNYPYGPQDYFGQPLQNGMIAVDPRVIPLHTVLYVTGYHDNYLPTGGFLGQAMDTGGAIQGDRVDLFINASPTTIGDFGVQQVTVYQLGQ